MEAFAIAILVGAVIGLVVGLVAVFMDWKKTADSRDEYRRAYELLKFEYHMLKNDLPARAPNGRFVKRGRDE